MKIFSISNPQEGVGKSVVAINLAASFAAMEKDVLLLDLDPSCSLTTLLGHDSEDTRGTILELLFDRSLQVAPKSVNFMSHFDFVPACQGLINYEINPVSKHGNELGVKQIIERMDRQYDFILLDCPSNFGLLNINALVASGSVIIPLNVECCALETVARQIQVINLVKEKFNQKLSIGGFLFNFADERRSLYREAESKLRHHLKTQVCETVIPNEDVIHESFSRGLPAILMNIKNIGCSAFMGLAEELISRKLMSSHHPRNMR